MLFSLRIHVLKFYGYHALDSSNTIVRGVCFAFDEEELQEILRQKGFCLVFSESRKPNIKNFFTTFVEPFFLGLDALVSNHIDLISSLNIVLSSIKKIEERAVVENIVFNIKNGRTFASSLKNFDMFFDLIIIKMIEMAEKTAMLDTAIKNILAYVSSKISVQNDIKNSLRYPIILVCVMFFVVLFWLFFVVPVFADMFEELGVKSPLTTRAVLSFRTFCIDYYIEICLFIFAVAYQNKGKRYNIFAKKIRRDQIMFSFFSSVGAMLKERVELLEAIECAAAAVNFDRLLDLKNFIKQGNTLSQSMRLVNVFNDDEIYIVEAGENAGNLWPAFQISAQMLKRKSDLKTKKILSLMQPISVIFIGGIILLIVSSVLLPMYARLNVCC